MSAQEWWNIVEMRHQDSGG